MRTLPRALPVVCLVLWACSGSGGGAPVQPTGDVVVAGPPSARTDAAAVVLRGTATESQAGIEVGGVAAQSDDGFLTWRAEVPLQPGTNRLEVVQVADSGGRALATTVTRERVAFLTGALDTLTTPPDRDTLVAVGLGVGPDDDGYVGTGLDAITFDLDARSQLRAPLPLATFELAPTTSLFAPLGSGDTAVLRMVGWGRDCQCPLDQLVTVDLAGRTDRAIPTPGLLRLASHSVATSRPDELAFTGIDGFGMVGADGSDPRIMIPADGSFRPRALCLGADDSTFFVADAARDVVWRVTRGSPTPERIAGPGVGLGDPLGIVRSLGHVASRDLLFTVSAEGLARIDLATLERSVLSTEPDLDHVACTSDRAFVLSGGFPEELDLDGGTGQRTPLLERGLPAGPDWSDVLALSHVPGSERIACVLPDGVHWLDLGESRASRAAVLFGIRAPAAVDAQAGQVAWSVPVVGGHRIQVVDFDRTIVDGFEVVGEALALDFDPASGALAALVRGRGSTDAVELHVLDPLFPGTPTVLPLGVLPGISDLRFADGIAWISHVERPNSAPHGLGITRIDVARSSHTQFGDPPLLRSRFRALFVDRERGVLGAVGDTRLATTPRNTARWQEASDGRAPQLGGGPAFLAPRAACALQGRDEALVFDLGLGGLIHVDLLTGERSVVAF